MMQSPPKVGDQQPIVTGLRPVRIVERDSGNNLSASGKDTTESKVIAENYKVRLAYLTRRGIEK